MKLIDMLVEDGLNGWQWPDGVECITQDNGSSIYKGVAFGYHKAPYLKKNIWLANNGTGHADAKIKKYDVVADDWDTAIITREQYEAALAAKNDGWIEWGGGECPVNPSEMVDVIFGRGGRMSTNIADCWRWNHSGTDSDIIAYRLHRPQKAEQAKADDEADLNECIGQDAAPVWNGEGVIPPVGCTCERSWAGDEWQPCKILFASNQIVVVKLKEGGMEDAYNIGDVTFRPIRSEADRKRDAAVEAIDYWMPEFIPDTPNKYYHAKKIYDAIAAGKTPGVKLED